MERIGEINMATKQEGFRNFDLKNLDLEFQIKKIGRQDMRQRDLIKMDRKK